MWSDIPPRTYRATEEICADIRGVREEISDILDMLNVRTLLTNIISEDSESDMNRRIEALNELLDYAGEALAEMRELEELLDALREELYGAVTP